MIILYCNYHQKENNNIIYLISKKYFNLYDLLYLFKLNSFIINYLIK